MSDLNPVFAAAERTASRTLGRPVTYQPVSGPPVAIRAIYGSPTDRMPQSCWATYEVLRADLAAEPVEGDTIRDGVQSFKVVAVIPDEPIDPIAYLLGVNRQ